MTWYEDTLDHCRGLARETGLAVSVVAGVVAATSPRTKWALNLRIAGEICRRHAAGDASKPTACMGTNHRAALRVLDGGEPSGNKVHAFWRAILGDRLAVVLDAWMIDALGLPPRLDRRGRYDRFATLWEQCCLAAGLWPRDAQADVWITRRGSAA